MAVYLLRAGTTVWYEIFSITGLAIGATVALGVLVGFARPGALTSAEDRSRLEREAHTDNLTGLRNTRAFNEDFARELARAAVSGHTVGLVLLDVDGLKTVNDTQGHQVGDELILAVSTAMRKTLRQGDLAYRIGGTSSGWSCSGRRPGELFDTPSVCKLHSRACRGRSGRVPLPASRRRTVTRGMS